MKLALRRLPLCLPKKSPGVERLLEKCRVVLKMSRQQGLSNKEIVA